MNHYVDTTELVLENMNYDDFLSVDEISRKTGKSVDLVTMVTSVLYRVGLLIKIKNKPVYCRIKNCDVKILNPCTISGDQNA